MKIPTRFFFILMVILPLCPYAYARQAIIPNDQAQADIERFTQELLTNIAAAAGQRDAAVTLLISTQLEVGRASQRIAAEKEKTGREYARAQQDTAIMRSRIRTHGGAQSIDTDAYKDYQQGVQRTAAAQASFAQFKAQDEAAKQKVETTRRELEIARKERDAWVAGSQQQKAELTKLYKAWKENDSEDNFKAVTGQLTVMAAAVHETSDVDLVTKKNNEPNPGAVIKYEGELDRKNKVEPIRSANCATGCTETGMPKGWFYMWSERDRKETSDKNRYVHIKGPKDTVEIIENP
jgi:hypothetical protein